MPPKMVKGAAALVILQQPAEQFFKDEGGKQNGLCCVVTAPSNWLQTCLPALGGTLNLKCTLYYESEQMVESKEQKILNLQKLDFEKFSISRTEPSVEIRFRLEKVSRRKDGQKFKVFVEPDYSDAEGTSPQPLNGVFTIPILVMSKRRTGERATARRPRTGGAMVGGGLGMGGVQLAEQLNALHMVQTQLFTMLQTNSSRLERMEAVLNALVKGGSGVAFGVGAGAGMVAASAAAPAPTLPTVPVPGMPVGTAISSTGLPIPASAATGVPTMAAGAATFAAVGTKRGRGEDPSISFDFPPDTTQAPPIPGGVGGVSATWVGGVGAAAGAGPVTAVAPPVLPAGGLAHGYSNFSAGSFGVGQAVPGPGLGRMESLQFGLGRGSTMDVLGASGVPVTVSVAPGAADTSAGMEALAVAATSSSGPAGSDSATAGRKKVRRVNGGSGEATRTTV